MKDLMGNEIIEVEAKEILPTRLARTAFTVKSSPGKNRWQSGFTSLPPG